MKTLNNAELNAVVGGCCANTWVPEERVIKLPIQPGTKLYGAGQSAPVSQAFTE